MNSDPQRKEEKEEEEWERKCGCMRKGGEKERKKGGRITRYLFVSVTVFHNVYMS